MRNIWLSEETNNAGHSDPDDLKRLVVLDKRNQAHDKLFEFLREADLKPEDMSSPDGELRNLKLQFAGQVFQLVENKMSDQDIITFLLIRLADMFHRILD